MSLNDLIDKRKDILFAEIGALIHDLGKLSKEFVESKSENGNYNMFVHSLITHELQNLMRGEMDFFSNFLSLTNNQCNIQSLSKIYHLACTIELIRIKDIDVSDILNQAISDYNSGSFSNNFAQAYIDRSSLSQNEKEVIKKRLPKRSKIVDCNNFNNYINIENNSNLNIDYLLTLLKKIKISLDPKIIVNEHFLKKCFLINFIALHHNKYIIIKEPNLLPYSIWLLEASNKNKGADGIDSAIDKMVADVSQSKQSKDNVYISTAFGYEREKIDLNLSDTDEKSLAKIREDYANKLADILNTLKDKDFSNNGDLEIWVSKRDELLKKTRKAFLKALGETRRPANDVTLWDHSFSVASLYKTALAEVVINQWKNPKDIKWKLLSVRFDGDEFYHSVNKIADVLGRKSLVEKVLENIRLLLEVIIPIGNEIYRDENGSVFLVPESLNDSNLLVISDDVWDKIKKIEIEAELDFKGNWNKKKLEEIINNKPDNIKVLIESMSSFISQGIFVPDIQVSESSRGALNIGREIVRNSKHKIEVDRLKTLWDGKEEGYFKCSVCGIRPIPITPKQKEELDKRIKESGWKSLSEEEKNNYKAFERKVCIDCLKSAFDRVKEWKNNQKWNENEPEKPSFDTSIWLDEIADKNNRIALVYLSFELGKWLGGEMLNTFLSKPLLDSEFKSNFENELWNINNYTQLVDLIKKAFEQNDFDKEFSVNKKDGNKLKVNELFQILGCFIQNGQKPLDVFHDIVEQREPDWQNEYECPAYAIKGDNYHKAIVFLLYLTRKHPSFARLRRIWETTREFGIEIFKKAMEVLKQKRKEEKINWQRPVIQFAVGEEERNDVKITHTYYFKDKNDTKFELVILSNDKAAVILNGNKFDVPESRIIELYDEDFKNVVATLGNVRLSKPKEFYPLITYQFEPTKTLFFMPLKHIWEVIETIKEEYEIQFNKVQNRLPIKVGFVAFNKKMPMYVVLEAARKMYSKEIEQKELEVCNITEIPDDKNYRIKMDDNNEYYFSYSTGDPDKKDLFHPYFVVKNNNGWKTYFDKKWQIIKHVKDLQEGDKVLFYPSKFDFLYLDSNIRRFDVGEKRRHWLFKKTSPKPYNLKDIEKFERLKKLLLEKLSLTASQLLNLYGLLIAEIQEWGLDRVEKLPIEDLNFKDLIKNSILSIPLRLKISDTTKKGEITQKDFEFFKDSILNGMFFDLIDMWHTVLKRKFKEENNE